MASVRLIIGARGCKEVSDLCGVDLAYKKTVAADRERSAKQGSD
jgi:hypothetical protein